MHSRSRQTSALLLLVSVVLCYGPVVTEADNGTYAVVAPKTMRPGSSYECTVTLFSGAIPVTFNVKLQEANTQTVLISGSATLTAPLQPQSQTISFQIPAYVPPGSYYLIVAGSGGQTFSQNKSVNVATKRLSIFIQTDKSLYKPGQTVLFRCIAVYSSLLPYKDEINVTVYDESDNKISQWLNGVNSSGVIGQQLQLADQTPLGTWRIECSAGGNTETHKFTVAEYVLPKFEVDVLAQSFFLVNMNQPSLQKDLYVTLKATYTYGQPVKGTANITVELQHYNWDSGPFPQRMYSAQLVDGTAEFQVSFKELLALIDLNGQTPDDIRTYLIGRTIVITAYVLETVTGVTQSGNTTVPCTNSRYKLNFLSITENTYRHGMEFTGYLQLSQYDDSPPLLDDFRDPSTGEYRRINVKASMNSFVEYPDYQYSTDEINIEVQLNSSGYEMFTMKFEENASSVTLEASLYDLFTNFTMTGSKYLTPFNTRDSKVGIQLQVSGSDGTVKPETTLTFTVITTTETELIYYQFLSKGLVVVSDSASSLTSSTTHTFNIFVSKSLAQTFAPAVTVVAWYMTDTLEIVADSIKLTVTGGFANQVSLTFDKESVKPAENISLTVNACPGSFVGVLVVDQSVLLLDSTNRFTQDSVSGDLDKYNSDSSDNSGGGPIFLRWWWPYSPGGSDTTQVLDNAGLLMITDAYIYQYIRRFYLMERPLGAPGAEGNAANGPADQGGSSGTNNEPPRIRSNFPETFIWTTMTAGSDSNSVTYTAVVPDTITSWVASAFAVDDKCGLGVSENDAKLTVFQTFFISVTAPYSVIRGEEFAYLVTVFNYFNQSLSVTVTLKQSSDFKVRTGKNGNLQSIDVVITINVPAMDAVTVYFWIAPQSLGQIPISVQATSSAAGDAMKNLLLVKPEGVEQSYSTSALVQLSTNGQTYSLIVNTTIPPTGVLVPGSQHITCTAIGDIMGPSIQGLDNLIQLPTGCGEQNMLSLAPDVSVVGYLKASGQDTPQLVDKAIGYMLIGYQRELTYQHLDGSFSAFGDYDLNGSTWLSAFVVKVFNEARDYIPVEDSKIAKTLNWMIAQQNPNGTFNEPGKVIHTDMQGGSSSGVAMTAFVLISLCINRNNTQVDAVKYESAIQNGTSFLLTQIDSLNSDPYSLAIVIHALITCEVDGWESAFTSLKNNAVTEGGNTHWEQPTSDPAEPEGVAGLNGKEIPWRPAYTQSPSRDIELTSYVLLIIAYQGSVSDAVPVCKWLVSQRNSLGGYSSTQDTVMALQALTQCALMLMGPSTNGSALNVNVSTSTSHFAFQPITRTNALILQQTELPQSTTRVQIKASGSGTALVQVNVKYNVYNVKNNNGIVLNVTTTESADHVLSVTICNSWTGSAASGMCLLEVNILTGYLITNQDTLKDQSHGAVDRIESDKEKLVLYFSQLSKDPVCLTVTMRQDQMVNNVQRALIKLYRYYDKDSVSSTFYQPTRGSSDYCVSCAQCCENQNSKN